MIAPQHLLTDDQMRHFISHGYLILKTDFSQSFHDQLSSKIEDVVAKEGNPGNNILPRIPEMQDVFDEPTIRGCLTSILGPNYIMHPHRHCHYSTPGRKVQHWHKDSYWGYQKMRNHHPWWAMIFYYPQAVTDEMGPSAMMPGTQYYAKRAGDSSEQEIRMLGEAGTFALIHYDLWHKGTGNISTKNRSMMKFQFVRMDAPDAPTWQNENPEWVPMNGDAPPNKHESIWQHQWNWLSGRGVGKSISDDVERDASTLALLADKIQETYEPTAVDAAYQLAAIGEAAIPTLVDALKSESKTASRNAGYGLSAMGETALDGLVDALSAASEEARGYAAFALGELADGAQSAVPALTKLCRDESAWVRRNMVEALGTIKVPADGTVPSLISGLKDEDEQVRFTSALALARIGSAAEEAIPALKEVLQDENRYVRAKSVQALRRIGTPTANNIAFDHLLSSRWCDITTPENTF